MAGDAVFAIVIDGLLVKVTVAVSSSVTVAPAGDVPAAVAVLTIDPASTSAWVTVYVAAHVVDAPGASVAAGHVIADRPGSGSVTPTALNVTLPVFVTTNEYVTTLPTPGTGVADLASAIDGVSTTVTAADAVSVTSTPPGEVPVTVAVFAIEPASRSACVTVYVAVQVVRAPGASVVTGQVIADRPGSGSATTIGSSVTLPVFSSPKV